MTMKRLRVLVALLFALTLFTLSLGGCGGKPATPAPAALTTPAPGAPSAPAPGGAKIPTVGILQFVAHPALDATRAGAVKELEREGFRDGQGMKLVVQVAQGDMANSTAMAQKLKSDGADLIITVDSPSTQAAYNVTKQDGKPAVVFSSVDPFGLGLAKSKTEKAAHVTGVVALPPVGAALDMLKQVLPAAKRIGVIWNPGEANSRKATALIRELAPAKGLEVVEVNVSKSEEVLNAAQGLTARKVDAIFISTDSTVVAAFESVVKAGVDAKVPVFANDPDSAPRGAIAALGLAYDDVGRQLGNLAARILKGTRPDKLNLEDPERPTLAVNTRAAELMGVKLPEALIKQAGGRVYREIKSRS